MSKKLKHLLILPGHAPEVIERAEGEDSSAILGGPADHRVVTLASSDHVPHSFGLIGLDVYKSGETLFNFILGPNQYCGPIIFYNFNEQGSTTDLLDWDIELILNTIRAYNTVGQISW